MIASLDSLEEVTRKMSLSEFGFGETAIREVVNNCTKETSAIISQCNDYSQMVLIVGIVIGLIIGAAGMYAGMWYRGRQE